MSDRIREILGWYRSENPGVLTILINTNHLTFFVSDCLKIGQMGDVSTGAVCHNVAQ